MNTQIDEIAYKKKIIEAVSAGVSLALVAILFVNYIEKDEDNIIPNYVQRYEVRSIGANDGFGYEIYVNDVLLLSEKIDPLGGNNSSYKSEDEAIKAGIEKSKEIDKARQEMNEPLQDEVVQDLKASEQYGERKEIFN